MHLATAKFEHISRILRLDDGRRFPGKQTTFSFSNSDIQNCAVFVDGEPNLQDGMTVTAVLETPGDWQSVLGWFDHSTEKIQVFSKATLTPVPFLGLVIAIGFLVKQSVESTSIRDYLPWMALCLVSLLWLLVEATSIRKAIKTGALLRKVRQDVLSKD